MSVRERIGSMEKRHSKKKRKKNETQIKNKEILRLWSFKVFLLILLNKYNWLDRIETRKAKV